MKVTYEELKGVFDEQKEKIGGQKTDYFSLAYLATELNKGHAELINNVNFHDSSLGVDAYYVDKARGNLYLYIAKWAQNHHVFETALRKLIDSGLEQIFGDSGGDNKASQFLIHLKNDILENQAIIGRVFIHFVYNGNTAEAEKSMVLDSLREELEAKKFKVDQFFLGKAITFSTQFISNKSDSLSSLSHTRVTHQYEVNLTLTSSVQTTNGEIMHLGLVSLMDLYKIYQEMDYRFFERNIRAGLSADRPPNKEIRKSLKKMIMEGTESPDTFVFNHNGVTISAEKFEILGGKAFITEPRLLNGAQTVTSFAAFIHKNEKNPAFARNKSKLFELQVVVKVIVSASSEFVTHVTICNNRQNPVAAWNLRSNDLIQLQFQDKFREDLKIYYERQEKAFDELTDTDLEEMGIADSKKLEVRKLAQSLLAIQGDVDRMSRLTEVFTNAKIYNNTFRPAYLKSDTRALLFCYKIQLRLGRIIKEFQLDNYEKFYFIRGGKNTLWALLIQALLNENDEDELEKLYETYGRSLTVEQAFTDLLKDWAIKKLKPVLLTTIKESPFIESIEQEKYAFVKGKKFFNECMNNAGVQYGWQKKKI